MIEPKTLSGFMELLPSDQILFNSIKDVIRKNYEKYGFLPLDTPVIESSDVLLAKAGGETEKQIYQFSKADNNLCLRFDLTVPLAKYVALNFNELAFPFARYQIGKVYRGERPQKGRFREFYQCDIDVVGRDKLSLYYDALIPSVIYNIFRELNVGQFKISVSNRKLLMGLFEYLNLESSSIDILRLIDKFSKIGEQNFVETLKCDYKISDDCMQKILEFIKIDGNVTEQLDKLKKLDINNDKFMLGVEELEFVTKQMLVFGIDKDYFNIDLSIARGLDYYTGTVYETTIVGYESLGSVCSGGRYENLASFYTKEKLPGVGMSIGLTRLFYKLKENNLINSNINTLTKAIIFPMGETFEQCIKLDSILKKNNINSMVYFENTKFKNKINYANKLGIKYAIFIGEDEVKNNNVSIKNLETFDQTSLSINDLVKFLQVEYLS